jgi:hypothetical protein
MTRLATLVALTNIFVSARGLAVSLIGAVTSEVVGLATVVAIALWLLLTLLAG